MQVTYKVGRDDTSMILGEGHKQQRPFDTLIRKLKEYQLHHTAKDITDACQVIIRAIEGDYLRSDLRNPFSYTELMQLQRALSMKAAGTDTDVVVLMQEVKNILKLNVFSLGYAKLFNEDYVSFVYFVLLSAC